MRSALPPLNAAPLPLNLERGPAAFELDEVAFERGSAAPLSPMSRHVAMLTTGWRA